MRRKGRRGFPSAPTGTPAPAETLAPAESAEELVIEELADEDVPLASVPETGDAMLAWASAAALSGLGLAFLSRKKKEDEA